MERALINQQNTATFALIDGNMKISLNIPSLNIIKGDNISLSIAAASIVAKVTRDRIMANLDTKYPGYGWAENSGYGTKKHSAALNMLGKTYEHRKSFKPLAKYI